MCGYVDQEIDENSFSLNLKKVDHFDYPPFTRNFAEAPWLQSLDEFIVEGRPPLHVPNVGGIGDQFLFHISDIDGSIYKQWSKFGMTLPLYPGNDIMYFNATIEKMEEYHKTKTETGKISKFGEIVLSDFIDRPCVVFVNRVFEADKLYNTGYYKIERKDGGYIPLACFHGAAHYDEMQTQPAHTIVTRDPYPSILKIGHHRSPVILPYGSIYEWLDIDRPIEKRLEIASRVDDTEYIFEMVNKKAVTGRSVYAREALEDGIKYQGTLLNAHLVE